MSGNGRFVPEPNRLYRVFYLEKEPGGEILRHVVGTVTIYDDGSALVEPTGDKPSTFLPKFEKMVEYVPSGTEAKA